MLLPRRTRCRALRRRDVRRPFETFDHVPGTNRWRGPIGPSKRWRDQRWGRLEEGSDGHRKQQGARLYSSMVAIAGRLGAYMGPSPRYASRRPLTGGEMADVPRLRAMPPMMAYFSVRPSTVRSPLRSRRKSTMVDEQMSS